MTIYETEVPGVGHKFELEVDGGERLVVIIHHDGKRDVYRRPDPDADSEQLFSLTGKQARQLGSILEGAYFQPVELDEVEVPLGEAIIEWTEVGADAPVAGETLADANIRKRTGVSVMAIQRGGDTIPNPGPDETIETGDVLVTLGSREEQSSLEELVED
ncbi:potassium/proton antiporter regulatory subunit, CPA2 family [Halomicrobium zhouii]|uniref:Potassium/proton antiporter regulatory subunit, CPA2 family n=1 Tax=Halomicrobium zhouii TaxID=767519 RepID=A0A1I6K4V5_9EURY|nr:TrkA C-terminal domain-containing protein [Halomicrobium zhouii]SFR86108.1 potassium/proton antiporter regulatory subunit, CPA2 family [Halomicrobium zhouii]